MARKIVRKTSKKAPSKSTVITKKATVKKSSGKTNKSQSVDITQFLLPGVVAFGIVWALKGSLTLAGFVFLGVLAGNWFGQTYKNKKR